jgi:serine/threonine protein kinase
VPWLPIFIDQVLSGLAYIHQKDMVHRDLKPENILFNRLAGPGSKVCSFYISDFGLVTHEDSLKRSSKDLAGTRYYRAPETALRGECSRASDIYAFAVMLLEILGIYCPEEGDMSLDEWRRKLWAYGVREYKKYRDILPAKAIENRTQNAHSRIQSLVDYGLVISPMPRLLQQDPRRRATVLEARQGLLATYGALIQGSDLPDTLSQTKWAGEPLRTEPAELDAGPPRTKPVVGPPQTQRVTGPPRTERAVELPAKPAMKRQSTARRFVLPSRWR